MKVVIGLGNPGARYERSRHNAGSQVVRQLAEDLTWKSQNAAQAQFADDPKHKVLYVLPETFMNKSGETLRYLKKKHPKLDGEELFVIHDDLDIPLGEYKIQFGVGPHDHNGLLSLYGVWQSALFWHVRIGIDSRHGTRDVPGHEYVLQPFTPEEQIVFDQTVLQLIPQLRLKLGLV